jgi:hypothetical protein
MHLLKYNNNNNNNGINSREALNSADRRIRKRIDSLVYGGKQRHAQAID